jgi:hypothetical protein
MGHTRKTVVILAGLSNVCLQFPSTPTSVFTVPGPDYIIWAAGATS